MNPNLDQLKDAKGPMQKALNGIAQVPAREIFKVVAAAIILTWLGQGFFNLVDAVLCGIGMYQLDAGRGKFLAASGAIQISFSCLMLKSVSSLAEWVFPQPKQDHDRKESASDSTTET